MDEIERNNNAADEQIRIADELNRVDELKRKEMLHNIGRMRWKLATEIHELEDGSKLDFDRWAFQREIYQNESPDLVLLGGTGWGKASRLDAKVHTPSGWKTMGEIKLGDFVTTPDGGNAKVIGVFPQGKVPIYKVTFIDGRSTHVSGEHLWEVHHKKWTEKWKRGKSAAGTAKPRIITTLQLAELVKKQRKESPYTVPLTREVPKPQRSLPIDPYALGLLIGDGSLAHPVAGFTTGDFHLAHELEVRLRKNFNIDLVSCASNKMGFTLRTNVKMGGIKSDFRKTLERLGLFGKLSYYKFIPKDYLESSLEDRWQMMRGLMDTDGTCSPSLSYSTSSKRLADDVCELVRSLGGIAKIGTKIPTFTHRGIKKTGAISYKVNIRHPEPKRFFGLQRKIDALPERYQYADTLRLAVKSVEQVEDAEAQCILIDHPRHLYITDDYIVTHNSLLSILDDFAKAMCGLRVIHVCEKSQKRNAFVLGVVDPIMHRVPFYAGLLKAAAEDRMAEVDSAYAKHFGDGMIIYVGSNAESDFYSYRGDATLVDEHQLCDQDNLAKLFGRRTGSFWRFQTVMGNPKGFGTPENQNIHWQYLLSDQRQWQVPCPYCHEFQKLGWFSHFVEEVRNDFGAIVNVKVRDEEREDQEELEIRPICSYCGRPMRRLHPEGRWKAMNPGKRRTGYQLANFYNPDANMNELMGEYRKGLHNPNAMASFINDQTGEPYATSGSNITSEMLQAASTCVSAGIDPYQFVHANELNFQDVDIRT